MRSMGPEVFTFWFIGRADTAKAETQLFEKGHLIQIDMTLLDGFVSLHVIHRFS